MKKILALILMFTLTAGVAWGADSKISALTAVTTPATTDEIPVNQGGTTKKETIAQILGLEIGTLTASNWCYATGSPAKIQCTQAAPASASAPVPATTCTNQYVSAIATSGSATCTSWPTFNQNTSGTAAGLSATLGVGSGGTGIATANADTTIMGAGGTTAFSAAAMPSGGTNGCSGTGDKLLYNTTTHAWTCGTDQTGSGSLPSEVDHAVAIGSGSSWTTKIVPDCTDTGGNHLNFTQATDTWSCGTSSSGGGSGDVTDVGSCSTGACFTSGSPSASLTFNNATSGSVTLQTVTGALGSRTISLPAETGTVCTTGSVCSGYAPTASPTLTTPTIGVATATSVNKWAFTAPTTAATLTAGGDNATYTFPATSKTIMATDFSNAAAGSTTDLKITTTSTANGGLRLSGSSLTAGSVYYMASGGLTIAKADSATTMPAVCIADTTTSCMYSGVYKFGFSQSWTAGQIIYVSASAGGGLVTTAPSSTGNQVQRVGVALAADTILIRPSIDVGTVQ